MSASDTATAATEDGETQGSGADPTSRGAPAPGAERPEQLRFGRYAVIRELGRGGMGIVYAAFDDVLDRLVAIKLVRTDSRGGDAHARILREAKALAQLSHPNVVQIHEVSASAGRIFIVMEYVRGATLGAEARRLRASRAPARAILDLYLQAGRGLAAAHAEGIAHRDFKPDNAIVGEDGRVRVIDFGLATLLDPGSGPPDARSSVIPLTRESALLGTPAYMSPEQLAGRPADARSDQFSFCVALYEALAGERPFAGNNIQELEEAIQAGTIRSPRDEEAPRWVLPVLRRGLRPDAAERFPSLEALLAELGRDPLASARRRRRAASLALASAASAALLVVVSVQVRQGWAEARRDRDAELAWTATAARIEEARASGDEALARETFAAFVDDPSRADTEALTRAWLDEAAQRRARSDLDGARAGFAAAYATAPTGVLRFAALRGLAEVLRARLDWDALANLVALVERDHPAAVDVLADIRVDTALARRDFAGARSLLARDGGSKAALLASLSSAEATPHRATEAYAAGDHLALVEERGAETLLHLVRRDAALSLVRTLHPTPGTDSLLALPGAPLQLVGGEGNTGRNTLYEVRGEALVPLHTWSGVPVLSGARVDLDGDGARELYLATGQGLEILELVDTEAGYRERVAYSATDTVESMPLGLLAVDLDDDGRDELAASFGGWYAYDVRLLGREADGHLVTRARDKLGWVSHLATLRARDGRARLALLQVPDDDNALVFPPGHTRGAAEGFYLYTFDGARLTRDLHLPNPQPTRPHVWFRGPVVADIDGDGHDDFAASFYDESGRPSTLIEQQDGPAGFTASFVADLRVMAAAQLDDDPALELIVAVPEDDHSHAIWTLGAGEGALPSIPPTTAFVTAAAPAADPGWGRRWQQAAALAALGLHSDAAAAFERLARAAPTAASRAAGSLEAGQLRARLGEHRPALVLLHEAALAPEHRADALRAALTSSLRLGDYDAAQGDLDALKALGSSVPEELAAQIATARRQRVELRFDRPLDPAWRVERPLALSHRPGDDALELASDDPGVLLSLPVEWSGDLFELELDVTLLATEYPAGLDVSLEGDHLIAAHLGTSGTRRGSATIRRQFWCYALGRADGVAHPIGTGPEDESHFVIRISIWPALNEVGCDVRDPATGVSHSQVEALQRPLPGAGRGRLLIQGLGVGPSWLRARVHRITLHGVRLVDEASTDRAPFYRALVESDPLAALAAFSSLAEPSPREQLWQAHALLQVGRVDEARQVWSRVIAAHEPPTPDLIHMLRAFPALYGPLLRESAGDRWLALLADAWRPTATNHTGDARARQELRAALASLDAAELLSTPDLAGLARACELLVWRARVYTYGGDHARARADFQDVLAALERLPAADPVRAQSWRVWLDFASLAARAGLTADAREALRAARVRGPMPLLVEDVIRARPELAELPR